MATNSAVGPAGEDKVHPWTIKTGTDAVNPARVIQSDMQKVFILAEVLFYPNLMDAGTYAEARKKGTIHLEDKT